MEFSYRFRCTIVIALIDFLLIILFKLLLKSKKFNNPPFFLYPNYIFAIGVFSSIFFFFINTLSGQVLTRIADSLVTTVKIFGFDILINDISSEPYYAELEAACTDFTLLNILRIIAPLITLRAALGIFRDYLTQIKYFFTFHREAHIFSELNEKSICLAKDIYENSKFIKPLIIFENISADIEEADEGLILACKSIGALFTKKHILDFHFMRLSFFSPSVYLIDNNAHENLNNVTKLYDEYKNHKYKFYVFTTDSNAEFFIDSLEKKNNKATIHVINQPQIIAYNLMINKPLFSGAVNNNSNKISVLVIGAGKIGMECIKTAMWCSRMSRYDFEIRIIDSCDRLKEFEKENYRFDENIKNANININYKFIQVDINSPEFVKCLHSYSNYNYIIISTGNDELTINTALKTKNEIIRKRVSNNSYTFRNLPVIVPIILNDNYYELFKDFAKKDEEANIFYACGVNSEVFTLKNIHRWYVDEIAMAYYNIYKNIPVNEYTKEYFDISESDKRSNRAAAVHSIYKLHDLGIDFSALPEPKEDKNKTLKDKLLSRIKKLSVNKNNYKVFTYSISDYQMKKIRNSFNDHDEIMKMLEKEHERWTVFSVLDGWSTWSLSQIQAIKMNDRSPENKKIHKLEEARLHGCITTLEGLSSLDSAFPLNKNADALEENKERDDTLKKFNIDNQFFRNDFRVCWASMDIINNKFNRHFVIETSVNKDNKGDQ